MRVNVTVAWNVLVLWSNWRLPEVSAVEEEAAAVAVAEEPVEEADPRLGAMLMVTFSGDTHEAMALDRLDAVLLAPSGVREL